MLDIVVRRLLWKELRTQWHVWVALAVAAVVLQCFVLVPTLEVTAAYPFYVAFVLTACYGVACGSVLFAGEKEEQTDDWLRSLPLSSTHLLAGKLLFLLASFVCFAALVTGSAAILAETAISSSGGPMFWRSVAETAWTFTIGTFALMSLAVLYSLLLERVMLVLVTTTATYFVVVALADIVLPEPIAAWILASALMVAVVDAFFVSSWLSGRSTVAFSHARTWLEGNQITVDRRSLFSLRTLRWAASRSPMAARTVFVLMWRELRAAVPFSIAWGGLGILMVTVASTGRFGGGFDMTWLLATPLVCGLMATAGDTFRQTFRFLTDRGLHPLSIWLAKHVVWMSVGVCLIVPIGFADEFLVGTAPGVEQITTIPGSDGDARYVAESEQRESSLVASLGLALYLLGHLCTLWIGRIIAAFCVAGFLGTLLVFWAGFATALDVPPMRTVWPLAIAGVAASIATINGWLMETRSRRRRLVQALWITAPAGIVIALFVQHRESQIPLLASDDEDVQLLRTRNNSHTEWSGRWQAVFRGLNRISTTAVADDFAERRFRDRFGLAWPRSDEDDGGIEDTPLAENSAGGAAESSLDGSLGGTGGLSEDFARELVEDLVRLGQELELDHRTIGIGVIAADSLPLLTMGHLLVEEAHQSRQKGELGRSWALLRAGLRLTEYLGSQLMHMQDLQRCWAARTLVHQEIHVWASDSAQTDQLLEEALHFIDGNQLRVDEAAIATRRRRYAVYSLALEDPGSAAGQAISERLGSPLVSWPLPSEIERTRRLMRALTATFNVAQARDDWTAGRFEPGPVHWPSLNASVRAEDLHRWAATTPWLPHDFYLDSVIDAHSLVAYEHATQLVLRLHRHRVAHGTFPDSLDTVAGQSVLPWHRPNAFTFAYKPEGLSGPLIASIGVHPENLCVIPPHVPLLWSPGRVLHRTPGGIFVPDGLTPVGHNGDQALKLAKQINALSNTDSQQRFSQSLTFVVVGHPPW